MKLPSSTFPNSLARSGALLLAAPLILAAAPQAQPPLSVTEADADTWETQWSGVPLRTYFMEKSLDLETWHYAPLVEFGTGVKSFQMDPQGEGKFFLRLLYVDDMGVTTLQEAKDADFDNDGIPNGYEVQALSTDPLDKDSAGGDSDTDGLPDGWELYHFGNLNTAESDAILQPDGLSNKEKAALGLNPNTDYSDENAAQPASYAYDAAGRLTGVTAPVAAGDYTPDEEGNLLEAQ